MSVGAEILTNTVDRVTAKVKSFVEEYTFDCTYITKARGAVLVMELYNEYRNIQNIRSKYRDSIEPLQILRVQNELEEKSVSNFSDSFHNCILRLRNAHSLLEECIARTTGVDIKGDTEIINDLNNWFRVNTFDKKNHEFPVPSELYTNIITNKIHALSEVNIDVLEENTAYYDDYAANDNEELNIRNYSAIVESSNTSSLTNILVKIEQLINSMSIAIVGIMQDEFLLRNSDHVKADNQQRQAYKKFGEDWVKTYKPVFKDDAIQDFKDEIYDLCERKRTPLNKIHQDDLKDVLCKLRSELLEDLQNNKSFNKRRKDCTRKNVLSLSDLVYKLYHEKGSEMYIRKCIKLTIIEEQIDYLDNGAKEAVIADYITETTLFNQIFRSNIENRHLVLLRRLISTHFLQFITASTMWFFLWKTLDEAGLLADNTQTKFVEQMNKEDWFYDNKVKCGKNLYKYNRYLGTRRIEEWDDECYQDGRTSDEKENACRKFKPICISFINILRKHGLTNVEVATR